MSLVNQFSKEERAEFPCKSKKQKLDHFYALWTAKESYVKALGKGLSCDFQDFSINILGSGASLSKPFNSDSFWYFKYYEIAESYMCCVCASHYQFPCRANSINLNELLVEDA